MTDGLKAKHRAAIIAALAANDRVERAVLFGSRAMGTNTVTSDVDIALFGQHLTLTDQATLAATCDELPMAQSVDLLLHNTIDNPVLVKHIRTHGVEWYRRVGGGLVQANRNKAMPFEEHSDELKNTTLARQFSVAKGLSAIVQANSGKIGHVINWPKYPLESFVDPERSICYGIVQPGKPYYCGVPIVRVNNFKDGQIDTHNPLRVNPKIEERYQRSRLQGGELLLTLVGTMGLSAIAPKELQGWNVARAVGVIPLKENVDKRWLNFVLRSQPSQDFIKIHANTTVQATFNLRDLAQLPIPLPPDNIRLSASYLLSVLDDKIELNRRMNQTLEAMAQAIFKDWFVDFGPVKAKMQGRNPYLPAEIWELFPDSFEDSELGEIPRGWVIRKLEDYLELAYGKSLPAKSRRPGPVPVYGSGGVVGSHDVALTEGPTVIVGRKGTVGSLYLEAKPAFPIDTVFHTLPRIGSMLFCYYLLSSQPLSKMNTDAAVPGLNRSNVYRLEFPCPTSRLISVFDDMVGCFWKRQVTNLDESSTLAQTRDLLLPRLISGELRLCSKPSSSKMEVA